jgi:hypothetical protein
MRTGRGGPSATTGTPVLLLVLSLCGFSGALATPLLDPAHHIHRGRLRHLGRHCCPSSSASGSREPVAGGRHQGGNERAGVPPHHLRAAAQQGGGDRGGAGRLCPLPVRRAGLRVGPEAASDVPEGVGREPGGGRTGPRHVDASRGRTRPAIPVSYQCTCRRNSAMCAAIRPAAAGEPSALARM